MQKDDPQASSPALTDSLSRGVSEPQIPRLAALIPDHELLRRIGSGSYGEVWLARSATGAYRAVKVVHRASFEQDKPYEREFAGILKFEPISRAHEGHVDILHVGRNDAAGYFYYVMELADDLNAECEMRNAECTPSDPKGAGIPHSEFRIPNSYVPRTLRSDLKRRGALPIDECITIGLALTRALAHLHGHGLVHRDIKPSNIIFVDGIPKLADIGLVTGIDATRSFVDTDGYIPPEGPGTPQADLYSLGKVLYEMSTGKDRQDFPELPADWRTSAERERLLEFNEVVLKACDDDVRQRYASAQQLESDLALLQHGQSVKRQRKRRARWAVVKNIAVVGAIATVGTLLLFLQVRSWHRQVMPRAHSQSVAVLPLVNRQIKKLPTQNFEAYESYLHARYYSRPQRVQAGQTNNEIAIQMLERAVALDTNFALAFAVLGC